MRKMVLMTFIGLMLAACGGGGSSSGGGGVAAFYTGNTSQATVTTSNAKAVSVDAMDGVQGASITGAVYKATSTDQDQAYLPQLSGIVAEQLAGAFSKAPVKTVAQTQPVSGSRSGYTGSFSYAIDANLSTGTASGTFTFNSYQERAGGEKVSGTVSASGTVNTSTGNLTGMDVSMTNLSVSSTTKSFLLNGSLSMRHSGNSTTIALSVVEANTATNTTYWMKDLTLTMNGSTMTISGTYYDHTYGYVTITTETPLTTSSLSNQPTAGRCLFTGSGGTKARLTYTSTGYLLEVDTTGTNAYVTVP